METLTRASLMRGPVPPSRKWAMVLFPVVAPPEVNFCLFWPHETPPKPPNLTPTPPRSLPTLVLQQDGRQLGDAERASGLPGVQFHYLSKTLNPKPSTPNPSQLQGSPTSSAPTSSCSPPGRSSAVRWWTTRPGFSGS